MPIGCSDGDLVGTCVTEALHTATLTDQLYVLLSYLVLTLFTISGNLAIWISPVVRVNYQCKQ